MTSPAPSIWRWLCGTAPAPGRRCGKRLGLEIDHRKVDYRADGPTELDNLVRLCPDCHALKTFGGWRLEGQPGPLEVDRAGPPEECAVHHESPQTCGRQGQGHGGSEQTPQDLSRGAGIPTTPEESEP